MAMSVSLREFQENALKVQDMAVILKIIFEKHECFVWKCPLLSQSIMSNFSFGGLIVLETTFS